jgi:hypothetical protein
MAKALARSYRRFGPSRPFAVVTDAANAAALGRHFDVVVPVDLGHGHGVVQKLSVDRYSPFQRTLFVDSDCLFYKHPDVLWQAYQPGPFHIKGWTYLTGHSDHERRRPYEFISDVPRFLETLGLSRLGRFNSGVVYFEGVEGAAVFEAARAIYERRADLGFVQFKGAPIADEPALAAAMEQMGIPMQEWDRTNGMETAIGMSDTYGINVLEGRSRFAKKGVGDVEPALIHYNIDAQNSLTYQRDIYRLRYAERAWGASAANAAYWALRTKRLGSRLKGKAGHLLRGR